MTVVLNELLKRDDGAIQLLVSFGTEPARAFLASYDGTDPKCKFCSVDEELFMRLSDLAHKRFGNCTTLVVDGVKEPYKLVIFDSVLELNGRTYYRFSFAPAGMKTLPSYFLLNSVRGPDCCVTAAKIRKMFGG